MADLRLFFDALPNRKVELIDGRLYIAGSLERSAMTLHTILDGYGAAYAARWIPKDLLREAVQRVYPGGAGGPARRPAYKPVEQFTMPMLQINMHFGLSLFNIEGLFSLGRGVCMKLGEDGFMPGAYIIRNDQYHRQKSYYLDGPAQIILEFVHPAMQEFDEKIRLPRYAAAGVPEVWLLDHFKGEFSVFRLRGEDYVAASLPNKVYESPTLPGLCVSLDQIFENPYEAVFTGKNWRIYPKTKAPPDEVTPEYHSVSFAPRLALEPVPITFEEYISWGGEPKFEWVEGCPLLGGSNTTTEEYMGLLMMTLGVRETVPYLPAEAWREVLSEGD